MAIGNYGQLKSAIAAWTAKSNLVDVIPDFISLAEANIRRDVRCRAMEASATGTLSAATLAFPARLVEIRRVLLDGRAQKYVTPEVWARVDDAKTEQYSVLGQTIQFQSGSATYQVDYFRSFESFSAEGDTNWLLTNYPDVYLFASLAEAADHFKGDRDRYLSRYMESIRKLRNSELLAIDSLAVRPDFV